MIVRTHKKLVEFIWDKGNLDKNWLKHQVTDVECEEIFFDENKVIYKDVFHSEKEERYILLGKSRKDRSLYEVFTTRNDKIRIISCRDTNKKERKLYEKST